MIRRSLLLSGALTVGAAMLGLPLQAQLNPLLQTSKTDFLDLYQQSTNTKVKPEILTLFDFSGSMAALMFHPLYVNNDVSDSEGLNYISFTLTPGVPATNPSNTYIIKATADGCPQTYAAYTVTVNSNGSVSVANSNLGPNCVTSSAFTITAQALSHTSGKATATATVPITVGGSAGTQTNNSSSTNTGSYLITQSNGSTTTNPITLSPSSGPYTSGSTVTFTTYLDTSRSSHGIQWSPDGGTTWTTGTTGSSNPYSSTWSWVVPYLNYTISNISTTTSTFTAGINVTFKATLTSNGGDNKINWSDNNPSGQQTGSTSGSGAQSWTWTVPAYKNPTAAVPPYVTATLDPRNTYNPISGITYLTNVLTSTILVKPDGTQVAQADADAATTSGSSLEGASAGSGDVRNWVRAASHVRFSPSGSPRTVDVPIPWKIMDKNSTLNPWPMSSVTVHDQEIKVAANGTTTTYGSGSWIEIDQTNNLDSGNDVLDNGSTPTTTTINSVGYKPAYVSWLFTGTYANGTYAGKYIVFDAANNTLAGGQSGDTNANWGKGFGTAAYGNSISVPTYNLAGVYQTGADITADASVNIVPAMTRVQAVKNAAISTWVQYQADVVWAFRFLDQRGEASSGNATTIDNNSQTTFHNTAGQAITTYAYGNDSGWTLLNNTDSITSTTGNSVKGMNRIACLSAGDSTPLTYAMARSYAQFSDPQSVFNAFETGSNAPSQCMNHFLIVFTDGIDNNGSNNNNTNTGTPYLSTTGGITSINADTGNKALLPVATKAATLLNRNNSDWNMFTFAGAAAHLGDTSVVGSGGTGAVGIDYMASTSPGTTPGSAAVPSSWLPLTIYSRNGTVFTKPHLITTMTVGVSLGGTITNGPKQNLFLSAALGDPLTQAWPDITTLTPFVWSQSANNGNGGKQSGSIYFFDATNPAKLATSLGQAIASAVGASNINTATSPSTPFIGAALSQEILIGKFQPPPNGGAIWSGDLLMFGTQLVNDQLQFVGKNGLATTEIDSTTAQWSAYTSLLNNRLWYTRNLYTRLPGSSGTPEPGILKLNLTGAPGTAPTTGIESIACQASNNPNKASYPVNSSAQQQVIEWALGGDLTKLNTSNVPTANRSNIMGDVIDSSPAVLEYKWSDVSGSLTSPLASVVANGGNRFRLILVGTNQGWLHAFGEVTYTDNATHGSSTTPVIVKGNVDELWSFMPTDFLGYLDQLTVSGNPHRFLVDGAPSVYFLDLPPTSGGGSGDGVVEVTSAPGPEKAMVLFGLGKGGRSYYALDIHNPFTPSLRWSLVPDEAAFFPSTRILSRPGQPSLTTVQNIIKNMGFSTCTPGLGRIELTDATGTPVVHDAVFFGGGFSLPEVDANFKDANGNATPLGRSALALDVYTGQVLAAVDLTALSNGTIPPPGPVAKGVVPVEFILNSGMAQRAYFMDYWGGLWSWGCQKTDTGSGSATYQYRMDSSDLSTWTASGSATDTNPGVRLVAKDESGNLVTLSGYTTTQKYYSEALYTGLPAPFVVGSFPGVSKNTGGPAPAAVGVVIESGDRNNPLDFNYTTTTQPVNHQLTVVFDRQDSAAWGTVANPILITPTSAALLNADPSGVSYQAGAPTITPNNSSYYLAPTPASNTKFGYFVAFPSAYVSSGTTLIPKGINTPVVVSGSLFYSYFYPTTADPCTGGTGNTYTDLICDVINPVVTNSLPATTSCVSGQMAMTVGIASDFSPLGTRGVIQIGTSAVANASPGTSQTTLEAMTIKGKTSIQYPKARVWRTVH